MVSGRHKSRTFRRVFVKTTSGKSKISYRKRKPAKSKCGLCGAELKGVVRARPYLRKNMPKSSKRPSRPYGGNLCSKCMRKSLIARARS